MPSGRLTGFRIPVSPLSGHRRMKADLRRFAAGKTEPEPNRARKTVQSDAAGSGVTDARGLGRRGLPRNLRHRSIPLTNARRLKRRTFALSVAMIIMTTLARALSADNEDRARRGRTATAVHDVAFPLPADGIAH